ncbi:MAG: hypothetical protein AAF602_32350, partial [Myxococcota bacterium]
DDDLPLGTEPLPEIPITPVTPTLTSDGQHVVLPFYNIDPMTFGTTNGARAFVVSVETREVVAAPFDARCPWSSTGGVIDPTNGHYVYVGDALSGAGAHFAQPSTGEGCLLRIRVGETEFDPTWTVDAADMNPGGFGDLAQLEVAGDQFLAVFRNEDRAPIAELPSPANYFGGPGTFFRPYVGSVTDWTGTLVTGEDDQNFFTFPQVVDDTFVVSPADITNRGPDVRSRVYRVVDGALVSLTETPGFVRSVERIR